MQNQLLDVDQGGITSIDLYEGYSRMVKRQQEDCGLDDDDFWKEQKESDGTTRDTYGSKRGRCEVNDRSGRVTCNTMSSAMIKTADR